MSVPDSKIDTGDIPEVTDWRGGVRGLSQRPELREISIRLSTGDLLIANRLAALKGMPYQTYLQSLIHESLVREASREDALKAK